MKIDLTAFLWADASAAPPSPLVLERITKVADIRTHAVLLQL